MNKSNNLSKLGVVFIASGFLLLVVAFIVQSRGSEPVFLLSLGWFIITTGMIILALMGVLYAIKRVIGKFRKQL
ncbi:MAG: hypothetical protein MJ215_00125 [Spirochaetia bacterium]|nr:hypothetical protein [Spirochaetia bacterium]